MTSTAVIFSVPLHSTTGYCWRWRSVDGKTDSGDSFIYYYDCLSDARAKGYDVEPERPHGENAPGRASLRPADDRHITSPRSEP
jgi:hypothetical protein